MRDPHRLVREAPPNSILGLARDMSTRIEGAPSNSILGLIRDSAGRVDNGPGSVYGKTFAPSEGLSGVQSMIDGMRLMSRADTTAFRPPVERAIGATSFVALHEAAHAFAASFPATVVVPDTAPDPMAEVFETLGIELDATNEEARRAFVQGYMIASRYRYSTLGRWFAWALGVIGASTGLYGTVTHSNAVIIAGAAGILVAVFNFPEAKDQAD
jgi:hypothetical protein